MEGKEENTDVENEPIENQPQENPFKENQSQENPSQIEVEAARREETPPAEDSIAESSKQPVQYQRAEEPPHIESTKPPSPIQQKAEETFDSPPTKAPGSQVKSASAFRNAVQRSTSALEAKQPNPKSNASDHDTGVIGIPALKNFSCSAFFQKRSPFIHNPPQPEERRARIDNPRTPREYIINLRENLADFQESHGLPRTRDYSFMSLGLALAQETARALYSLFLMFAELFPIVAIVSLIMRFALDKIIEILETNEPVPKIKKSIIFALEMLVIIIPLWILIATIILPLLSLIFSIVKRMIRIRGRGCPAKKHHAKSKQTCSYDFFGVFY